MTQWTDDELRDLAPAYAMGTLDAADLASFESALASSPWLRDEVASHRAVLDALATSVRVTPPAALRARVLARVAREADAIASGERADSTDGSAGGARGAGERRVGGADTDGALRVVRGEGQRGASASAASSVSSSSSAASPASRWLLSGVLGAALAASLMLVVSQRSQLAETRTLVVQRDSALAETRRVLAVRETTLATLLEAEREVLVVKLASTGDAAPGVQFFWNVKARRGVLRAYGLAPAPAGKGYQVWLIENGKPVPMPVFNTDATGRAIVAGIEMPADQRAAQAIAITLEPASGSPAPTSQPFLVGTISRGD